MAIEVRELIVRSSTTSPPARRERGKPASTVDVERLRAEILDACRRMIADQQRRDRER